MVTDDSINSSIREIEDPIPEVQKAVHEAWAMLGCLKVAVRDMGGYDPDLEDACNGIMRILDGVHSDLDPQAFRRAILVSEPKGASHG